MLVVVNSPSQFPRDVICVGLDLGIFPELVIDVGEI